MTKCNFCKKIYTNEEAEKWKDDIEWYYHYDNYNILVKNDYNVFELWTRCDDNYYTGYTMTIQYCPKCGRKLAGAGTRS